MIDFEFPPLGDTSPDAGPVVHAGRQGEGVWHHGLYAVSLQHDVPTVGWRCHYPGGSSPCDEHTADQFKTVGCDT